MQEPWKPIPSERSEGQPEGTGSTVALVGEIIADAQKLMRQELSLAKVELVDEWGRIKTTLRDLGTAWVILGVGVLLFSFSVVHALGSLFDLPLWVGFLALALTLLVTGYFLYQRARRKLDEVSLVPHQAVHSVKENVQWIKSLT
jgi:Putative Actinobacterial Holin-X, holin superfamily III